MKYLVAAALLASTVSAHGGVTSYNIGGTTYPGWQPYQSPSGQSTIERQYSSYDPLFIADLGKINILCNNAGATGTGKTATVAAGSDITAYWSQWTHAEGCIMVYMAKCPSSGCNGWTGTGTSWFKINQVGLISGTMGAAAPSPPGDNVVVADGLVAPSVHPELLARFSTPTTLNAPKFFTWTHV
ncbi:hypothetical protein TWF706_010450 [Orbilia oligospora]|nr:hypothetical protein TWF706_010450 [Orbilia oligospora]